MGPIEKRWSAARRGLLFGQALVLRHRVVRQHLALEHPDLDAAGAVGGLGGAVAEIDVIARRKATRRSSCWAMPSAMSFASISGFLISTMLRLTSLFVILAMSTRSFS